MRRIDGRTVELTDAEVAASQELETIIDDGHGTLEAVTALIDRHGYKLSPEFYAYLADDFWTPDQVSAILAQR